MDPKALINIIDEKPKANEGLLKKFHVTLSYFRNDV